MNCREPRSPKRKCIKCEKDATSVFSQDGDTSGIASCDDHKDEVEMNVLLLFSGDEAHMKEAEKFFEKD